MGRQERVKVNVMVMVHKEQQACLLGFAGCGLALAGSRPYLAACRQSLHSEPNVLPLGSALGLPWLGARVEYTTIVHRASSSRENERERVCV